MPPQPKSPRLLLTSQKEVGLTLQPPDGRGPSERLARRLGPKSTAERESGTRTIPGRRLQGSQQVGTHHLPISWVSASSCRKPKST